MKYAAALGLDAHFSAQPADAFSFGTGDFTVVAMIMTQVGGPLVSRQAGAAGWSLVVGADSTVTFELSDSAHSQQVTLAAPSILDGACHTITALRSSSTASIAFDGVVAHSERLEAVIDVDNQDPLLAGALGTTTFTGTLMNVGLWARALTGTDVVSAAFARVTSADKDMRGYWTFDYTTADESSFNNPMNMAGPVRFMACIDCVWCEGSNGYAQTRMINAVSAADRLPLTLAGTTMTQARTLVVENGCPALAMGIMTLANAPQFPPGAIVTLTGPDGRVYDQDWNAPDLFVKTVDGYPWGCLVVKPAAGSWRVVVTAPAGQDFRLDFATIPAGDVVAATTTALEPLYGTASGTAADRVALSGGWATVVFIIGVSALVAVAVAGAVVGAVTLPAVAVGLAAFVGAEVLIEAVISPDRIFESQENVVAAAGYVVSQTPGVVLDALCPSDLATQLIGRERMTQLYPLIIASTFSKNHQQLLGSKDSPAAVSAALTAAKAGFVTASGYGTSSSLGGWYENGNAGPTAEVLTSSAISRDVVGGMIFHLAAGNTGAANGLGQALVAAGAAAFFGYSQPLQFKQSEVAAQVRCDVAIDRALLGGATCAAAQNAAIAEYDRAIAAFTASGDTVSARFMTANRDNLVGPSTSSLFGDPTARLNIGHP